MATKPGGAHGNIMLQARRMQGQIKQLQDALNDQVFEGSAGGGLVKVSVNGRQRLTNVQINPEAINPNDLGELADLVRAAVNMAVTASQEHSQGEMKKITGGIHLPGLF